MTISIRLLVSDGQSAATDPCPARRGSGSTTRRVLRFNVMASLLIISGLSGCSGGGGSTTTSSPSASPTASEALVVDQHFDVAPGRQLRLYCAGTGSPAVVFEAGGGSDSSDWPTTITSPLSERTRICAYDRAGTGASDAAPNKPRLLIDVVRDLDALLAAAKIEDKLLLVGQSLGGGIVLRWALQHPKRTAGLVIVDTDWPTTDMKKSINQLTPAKQLAEEAAKDVWNSPDNTEHISHKDTAAELEAAFRSLPGIPIRILSATRGPECVEPGPACTRLRALSVSLQRQWLKLSPTAVQVPVDSGHDIHQEAPAVVLREVETALKLVRP